MNEEDPEREEEEELFFRRRKVMEEEAEGGRFIQSKRSGELEGLQGRERERGQANAEIFCVGLCITRQMAASWREQPSAKHSFIVTLSSRPDKTSLCTESYMPFLVFEITGNGTSSTEYIDRENRTHNSSLWHPSIV